MILFQLVSKAAFLIFLFPFLYIIYLILLHYFMLALF